MANVSIAPSLLSSLSFMASMSIPLNRAPNGACQSILRVVELFRFADPSAISSIERLYGRAYHCFKNICHSQNFARC
jgi:hypothetical protein